MAKVAKGAVSPPKKQSGRVSVKQAEVLEGLELLKEGKGEVVKDDRGKEFLVIELDTERVESKEKAEAALFNLRWKFNPKNKDTGGNEDEFNRLFASAGHGGLKIYTDEDRGSILLAASKDYAGATAPAAKPARKAKSTAAKPAAAKADGNGK